MKIFIRCNGTVMGSDTLTDFVDRGLRGPWYTGFRHRGELVNCQIVRVIDTSSRQVEYHGLVDVRPTRIGWQLIQRLDGQRLNGVPVRVRKWFDRNGQGVDRRHLGHMDNTPMQRDRRQTSDRRRMVRMEILDELPEAVLRQPARAGY